MRHIALYTFANTLLEQKKYPEGLAEYRKILAAQPDLEGPLQNGAMAAYFAGDYKTAQEYYEKLKADGRLHPRQTGAGFSGDGRRKEV